MFCFQRHGPGVARLRVARRPRGDGGAARRAALHARAGRRARARRHGRAAAPRAPPRAGAAAGLPPQVPHQLSVAIGGVACCSPECSEIACYCLAMTLYVNFSSQSILKRISNVARSTECFMIDFEDPGASVSLRSKRCRFNSRDETCLRDLQIFVPGLVTYIFLG